MELDKFFYTKVFNFKYSVELSTRPEDSMGTDEQWEAAETALKDALESTGTPYTIIQATEPFTDLKSIFILKIVSEERGNAERFSLISSFPVVLMLLISAKMARNIRQF